MWKWVSGLKDGQRRRCFVSPNLCASFPPRSTCRKKEVRGAVFCLNCRISTTWSPAKPDKQPFMGFSLYFVKLFLSVNGRCFFYTWTRIRKTWCNIPHCCCFARNSMSSFMMPWLRPYLVKKPRWQTAISTPMSMHSSFLDQQAKQS